MLKESYKQYCNTATLSLFIILLFNNSWVAAGEVSVAVASNALQAVKEIKARFEKKTGDKVLISSGSTGKLYTQIVNGAPFDIFLAANAREPKRLEQAHDIVPGSRKTYAVGRLVLWNNSQQEKSGTTVQQLLSSPDLKRITLANPKTAPYGYAAQQYLQAMKLWETLQSKLIRAENVTQAFQFTQSQNVQLGFVALSQIKGYQRKINANDYWLVPQKFYNPIEQQGVILMRAKNNASAKELMSYLHSKQIKQLLAEHYGYGA